MPRRKKDAVDSPPPIEKPDGISDEIWDLSAQTGNLAVARALVEVCSGERQPTNSAEITHLIREADALQRKSLTSYLRLRDGIGAKLRAGELRYQQAKVRTDRLGLLLSDPAALVRDHAENGTSSRQDLADHDS